MQTQAADHRALLKRYLAETKEKNPAFSLRSLARKLEVSPATLSQLISGKRPLSVKTAKKIVLSLNLKNNQVQQLMDGLLSAPKRPALLQLEQDEFELLSAWYHFAILSLSETTGGKLLASEVAARLDLPLSKVKSALSLMARMGLCKEKRGAWQVLKTGLTTSTGVVSYAVRSFHREHLRLAEKALAQDVADRDFSGITMAISTELLPEAKEMIADFRRRMSDLLESGKKQEVYHLAIQLYSLEK